MRVAGELVVLSILQDFIKVRKYTEKICEPLEAEDFVVQPLPDVSPPKWHLAHTTWFFENFLLKKYLKNFRVFNSNFSELFNSYYKSQGNHWMRANRGFLSRPTSKEIFEYRAYVNNGMEELLSKPDLLEEEIFNIVSLGIHHEQQHQELLVMDIKYILSVNVDPPRYKNEENVTQEYVPLKFDLCSGGVFEFGADNEDFCFDQETPRHKRLLEPFSLANRLISNAEFLEFILDDSYKNPLLWKSDAWDFLGEQKISSPLYWKQVDGCWFQYNLHGLKEIDRNEPVSHISYYEADAFAQWMNARLPTEFEWEHMAQKVPLESGQFLEGEIYYPVQHKEKESDLYNLFGTLWEWTSSSFSSYPGYKRPQGAFGEYNGKFMCNQYVLRGGCLATPQNHFRRSYRNFFHPDKRWLFSGIRIAKDS